MSKCIDEHGKVVYKRNNAVISSGEVKDYKKLGVCKEDTVYLKFKKKGMDMMLCMRPDEAVAVCAALAWATFKQL